MSETHGATSEATIEDLRGAIEAVPEAEVPRTDAVKRAIDETAARLDRDETVAAIAEEPYWPKWDGAWWDLLLLAELGEHARIPARAVRAMVASLDGLLHHFPIREDEKPPGYDSHRDVACHCALGCMAPLLAACGVDVARELPWIAPWFARYQMSDGGLSCDDTAYPVDARGEECPSSMVGTIAPLEALLQLGAVEGAPTLAQALDRAAGFLTARRLRRGSPTRHNAEERDAALTWTALTFPRFYFYDVLRGATALARYAVQRDRAVPLDVLAEVAVPLLRRFPDGVAVVERRAFAGHGTLARPATTGGAWTRAPSAGTSPLLEAVSQIGAPSEPLTRELRALRHLLLGLVDRAG